MRRHAYVHTSATSTLGVYMYIHACIVYMYIHTCTTALYMYYYTRCTCIYIHVLLHQVCTCVYCIASLAGAALVCSVDVLMQ